MQTSNPAFNDKVIDRLTAVEKTDHMTISGTIGKTTLLFALLLLSAGGAWSYLESNPDFSSGLIIGSSLAGFIVAMIIIFTKPNPILISLYALLQGVVLGSMSYFFNEASEGIVGQAVLLTISIFAAMLILYSTRIITVTDKLRSGIILATFGVLIFLVVSWIISLFSTSYALAINTGTSGLLIALVIVLIAALNLLLDFDFIERGSKKKFPKSMEWYGAFGLMITLIWLYISILRLLARNN